MKRIALPVLTNDCCNYGCGNIAKFKNKSGNLMCQETSNRCPAIIEKNSKGIRLSYTNSKRKSQKDVYQSLPQETKDRMNWNKGKHPGTIFKYGGRGNHKSALISERGHKCEDCGLEHWKLEKIPLELEHIDGDNKNNIKNNLKLLCCNCHALTPTWRGRNINSGKIKVSDVDLLNALNKCNNIRQALQKVGLTPKGGNYTRAKRLMRV